MNKRIGYLMQKSLDGELNSTESQEFREVLNKNPELAGEQRKNENLKHLLSQQQQSFGTFFTEKLNSKIENLEQTPAGQAMIYAFYRIALPGLAAAVLLIMISLINNNTLSFDSISGVADLHSGYLSDFLLFNY